MRRDEYREVLSRLGILEYDVSDVKAGIADLHCTMMVLLPVSHLPCVSQRSMLYFCNVGGYTAEKNGGKPMIAVQLKRQITSLLDALPEPKLAVVFDLVQFLTERDLQAAWMSAQSQSAAYQEWIGSNNDIYDEVFADA